MKTMPQVITFLWMMLCCGTITMIYCQAQNSTAKVEVDKPRSSSVKLRNSTSTFYTFSQYKRNNLTNSFSGLSASSKPSSAVTKVLLVQIPSNRTMNETMQASPSILRPSFIKGLLANRKGLGVHEQQQQQQQTKSEEETEEVTQTIMVPVDATQAEKETHIEQALDGEQQEASDAPEDSDQTDNDEHESSSPAPQPNDIRLQKIVTDDQQLPGLTTTATKWPPLIAASANPVEPGPGSFPQLIENQQQPRAQLLNSNSQPNAEASLQLTSSEINSLLNDREAPEFYREREINGDGVLVGEEPARLGMAASGHYDMNSGGGPLSGLMGEGFGTGGNGWLEQQMNSNRFSSSGGGSDMSALYNQQRLNQAASEETDFAGRQPSAFNHRFGQSFNSMAGEGEHLGSGRLIQSPNEFSETNSYGGGSGSSFDQMGAMNNNGGSFGGYPNSPTLDRHASEMFGGHGGGGSFGSNPYSAGSGDFSSGNLGNLNGGSFLSMNGRLGQAASHNLQPFASSNMHADDYSAPKFNNMQDQFGHQHAFEQQRDFAGASHGQLFAAGSREQLSPLLGQTTTAASTAALSGVHQNRLMPLSPVVPSIEDLYSNPNSASSVQRETASLGQQHQQQGSLGNRHATPVGHKSQPQVHEPIEDDPTDTSDESQGNGDSGSDQQQQFDADDNQHYSTATTTDGGLEYNVPRRQAEQSLPSLVLNVPPPQANEQTHVHMLHSPNQRIEFSRVGSAGYLGPGPAINRRVTKKLGRSRNQFVQIQREERNPSENPAHVGKFIID